ncbi:hypothetical protein ABIE41_002148 [Bosea sp. OAE506]|uniref:helix-turn-helix domain-containing protein n=1 Tax=Bosea sp. OAE506 TaxID=2663870 RepID=UPI0033957918
MSASLQKVGRAISPSFADRVIDDPAPVDRLWTRQEVGELKLVIAGLRITPLERLIGLVIIDHYNFQSGRCHPSIARIAAKVRTKEENVRQAIRLLVAAGCISRISSSSSGSFLLHPEDAKVGNLGPSTPPSKKGGGRARTLPPLKKEVTLPETGGLTPPKKGGLTMI